MMISAYFHIVVSSSFLPLLKYDDKISDTHFEEHFNEILTQSGNIIGNVVVGTFSSEC